MASGTPPNASSAASSARVRVSSRSHVEHGGDRPSPSPAAASGRGAHGRSLSSGLVTGPAASCRYLHTSNPYNHCVVDATDNRRRFNVALGIEAQGFCTLR